jgi:hypothetical protein
MLEDEVRAVKAREKDLMLEVRSHAIAPPCHPGLTPNHTLCHPFIPAVLPVPSRLKQHATHASKHLS